MTVSQMQPTLHGSSGAARAKVSAAQRLHGGGSEQGGYPACPMDRPMSLCRVVQRVKHAQHRSRNAQCVVTLPGWWAPTNHSSGHRRYEVGAATHVHTTGTRHLCRPSHPMDRPRGYSLVLQRAGLAVQRSELSFI